MLGIFNVDVYGWGVTQDDGAGGQLPGDREAAFTAQRGYRLCRNILMAAENIYLQMQGLVWTRWVQSINEFQQQLGENAAHDVIGMRLGFEVQFNEFAPQVEAAGDLEFVSIDIFRNSDGLLVAEADYDLSP